MTRLPASTVPRAKAVIFWTVLIVVVLTALEVGARVGLRLLRGFDGKHLYQYAYDPYKNILPTPNFIDRRGIRHNSAGFRRSGEVPLAKPPRMYRIFLMGASTAYGLGGLWPHIQRDYRVLDNSQTIDRYLEQVLRDSLGTANVEVINAAITSTWTHHHLIYLNQRILRYEPDMVLFLDGFNDFFFFNPEHDQFASYAYGLPARTIMGDPTIPSLVFANAWWLFRTSAAAHVASRAAQTVLPILKRKRSPPPLDLDSAMVGLRRTFPRNAEKMHERIGLILRAEGVRGVFMLQPLLILARDRVGAPDIEQRLFEFNVSSYRGNYETFMHDAVRFVVAEETGMAQRVGATFIDLSMPFDSVDGQVFTDYAHLTPLGNRVLASGIAARILHLIRADLAAGETRRAVGVHPRPSAITTRMTKTRVVTRSASQ